MRAVFGPVRLAIACGEAGDTVKNNFRILQFVLNKVVGAADVGIGANAARLCMIISHLTQKAILFLEKRTCMQPLYRGYARKKKNAP